MNYIPCSEKQEQNGPKENMRKEIIKSKNEWNNYREIADLINKLKFWVFKNKNIQITKFPRKKREHTNSEIRNNKG